MKIPKKIKVGAHCYTIKITKVRDVAKGSSTWGRTTFAGCNVFLDSELAPSKLEETFIHEILHICFDQAGIVKDEKEEEQLVNAIANQLYPILKNNNLLR